MSGDEWVCLPGVDRDDEPPHHAGVDVREASRYGIDTFVAAPHRRAGARGLVRLRLCLHVLHLDEPFGLQQFLGRVLRRDAEARFSDDSERRDLRWRLSGCTAGSNCAASGWRARSSPPQGRSSTDGPRLMMHGVSSADQLWPSMIFLGELLIVAFSL